MTVVMVILLICGRITQYIETYPEKVRYCSVRVKPVFLVKGVLKIYSKFTGEQPCRSVISIKLQSKVA